MFAFVRFLSVVFEVVNGKYGNGTHAYGVDTYVRMTNMQICQKSARYAYGDLRDAYGVERRACVTSDKSDFVLVKIHIFCHAHLLHTRLLCLENMILGEQITYHKNSLKSQ
jgi:hypothetical protein